jgi:hypothetical protein
MWKIFKTNKKSPSEIKSPVFSWSQDGEDLVLAALLELEISRKGSYVDIGAHDPFRFSNTANSLLIFIFGLVLSGF